MNGSRSLLVVSALLLPSSLMFGLANRVFVSAATGRDANSCDDIKTPCQTFQGAVAQLNPNGEAIVLDSGGYGPVSITQGVTIEAPPGVLAFIHPPSGNGVTINAPGQTVVLRGLTVNAGAAYGINVQAVGVLHVESCVLNDFSLGILVNASCLVLVSDTIVRGCNQGALLQTPGAGGMTLVADSSRFEKNAGTGIAASNNAAAVAWKCTLSGNGEGVNANPLAFTATITLNDSLLTGNTISGVTADHNGTVRVANSVVTDNAIGMRAMSGGVCASRGDNTVEGNGTDLSGTTTYSPR